MLIKMWIFALVLAVAVAPLPFLAAAPGVAAAGLGCSLQPRSAQPDAPKSAPKLASKSENTSLFCLL
jgi:hypothetical protein